MINLIYFKKINYFLLRITFLMFFSFYFVYAENLGSWGNTYSIIEMDFLEFIKNRVKLIKNNGMMNLFQHEWVNHAKQQAIRPKPVTGLSLATKDTQFILDLSIKIDKSIYDLNGNLIVPADSIINPLDYVSLRHSLLFFDADDQRQLLWAKNRLMVDKKSKLILINGDINKSAHYFNKPVYFDQFGVLVNRFTINQIPASVSQHNKKIVINYFNIS